MLTWPVADGVQLRLLDEVDADEFFSVIERNRARLGRWLPWVEHTRSAEDVRTFIRETLLTFPAQESLHVGVWVEGKLAGGLGHRAIDRVNRSVSIGYWLGAAVEGKGVMTRAVPVFLRHLFETQK